MREEWLRDGEGEMFRDVDVDFGTICAEIGIEDLKAKEAIMKYYHLSKEDKELFWKFNGSFFEIKEAGVSSPASYFPRIIFYKAINHINVRWIVNFVYHSFYFFLFVFRLFISHDYVPP